MKFIVALAVAVLLFAVMPAMATQATMKNGAFGCKNIGDCEQLVSDLSNPSYFHSDLDMFVSDGKAVTFDAGEHVDLTDTESGYYTEVSYSGENYWVYNDYIER